MKYQVLERIFNKNKALRKFERLELDRCFHILDLSEQAQRFATCPEDVKIGKDIRLGFPEFIGLEDVFISLLEGKQEIFELNSIERANIYIDIYIIGEVRENYLDNKLIILIEDVTEKIVIQKNLSQKVNEANLVSSVLTAYQNYMEQVFTVMADALIVTTQTGEIKKVNRATVELFGYSEEELLNQPISLIIEDKLLQRAIQQRNLFENYLQNVEVVCRTKKKEKLLIAFSCSVICKTLDDLEEIVYIGRDITARERRQQRNGAQYTITRILSEAQNVKQAIPQVLQAICENLGWDLGELWTTHEYIAASNLQQHNAHPVLRCVEISSSRAATVPEFKAVTWQTMYNPGVGLPGKIWKTLSPHWIENIVDDGEDKRSLFALKAGLHAAFGFPILAQNEIFGVMVFFSHEVQPRDKDVIEMMISISSQISQYIKRKSAEEALLESEERYRDLFENANDLIQSVTPYGNFEYVNRACLETLGYSQAEISQMNFFDIVHPDYLSQCRRAFYQAMSGQKLEQVTIAFLTEDGQTIFVEGNISCKFVAGKPVATRGIFRNITRRIQVEKALHEQQQQTERLLLNILPQEISNRLKQQPGLIAEDFADVTVLFADIVDFTKTAAQLSAIQLVNLLNKIFSVFDRLSEQYHVEKIKTIGDAYMVVGGLPTPHPDHMHAIANMALDMRRAIACFNSQNNQDFSIRIGIHTGSVVAGVIGIKKFAYDLWGDTVNIASRMESGGMAGKIQVTQAVYQRLQDEFYFEKRGEIEVKGKGLMTTYFLLGSRFGDVG
ncbi:PAS domain S-box protein [Iningainema sp. BLCCT55]|uniref:Adenylate cyclase n=2 Tax=Iningainema TaxID=1932705 RepID=A0A8J6XHG0_9CYAN|nr:adenylate/guanylate cyclase domain-containing protein [Iningainema tapete]MBD2776885.1 PAS domain S-box protein [Iningainema tapete BLCC-T55]